MKLLFTFLLLTTVTSYSQESLDGVWGIKFGTSVDSAKAIANKKTGTAPKISDEGNVLTYSGCTFGSRKAELVKLLFWEKKLYGARIFFFPETDPEILSLYNNIKRDISEKYWSPQVSVESYKYPYEKGDGHELTAIKGGYSTIGSIWYFPESSKAAGKGTILLTVEPKIWIEMQYSDDNLSKEIDKKLKEKKNNDFK